MRYDFKLRTGFFKTQLYSLSIAESQLILTSLENEDLDKIVITYGDVITISFIQRNLSLVELEINARSGTYIGIFGNKTNIEEVCCVLSKEFGKKFVYQ